MEEQAHNTASTEDTENTLALRADLERLSSANSGLVAQYETVRTQLAEAQQRLHDAQSALSLKTDELENTVRMCFDFPVCHLVADGWWVCVEQLMTAQLRIEQLGTSVCEVVSCVHVFETVLIVCS